jgi:hypothetical protein
MNRFSLTLVPGEGDPPLAVLTPCYPACSQHLPRYEDPPADYVPLGLPNHHRVQVGGPLEGLPVETASQVMFR